MQAVKSQPPKIASLQKAVKLCLLPWFETNARDLPWRRNRTPYRVWVSEIMLQQTRVDTVIPYYRRWMKAFPSWKALACAPQSDVLKCWEGLGYYSRARNLHAAAKIISDEFGGKIPSSVADLKKLPGIGAYTAAAISSLAFNEDAAVVDGNVVRVLSRLFVFGGDTRSTAGKKQMQVWADGLLVKGRAGQFNEAMMELGALVCLPKNPKCPECPLSKSCAAFAGGAPDKFPVMRKKKKVPHIVVGAAVAANRKGEVLIAQRKQDDMLGGLWEFPGGKQEPDETIQECVARELSEELGIKTAVGEHLMTVKHAYSHFTMTMHVHRAKIISGRPRPIHCADYDWVKVPDLGNFAWSKADLQVVEKLQGRPAGLKKRKKG
ncbi:MAG: A/G-specific adenine glycosylase [Kiritimatiellaceae bacterium]|nr:A/G-specific adenine glycosylase [Kiritimatiellaceae bacterium]